MTDELQTGSVDRPVQPSVATAENSTTLAVQLKSQKRAKVLAAAFGTLGTLGFTLAGLSVQMPALLVPGLIAFGIGSLGGIIASAFSGAELDEKAIDAIGKRMEVLAERHKRPGA
ncbi:MAG: hypothetical protein SFW67_28510 [Myxococcaceae bacterium]|nr:hypothetical protein [Myxococcaceae bacterium]